MALVYLTPLTKSSICFTVDSAKNEVEATVLDGKIDSCKEEDFDVNEVINPASRRSRKRKCKELSDQHGTSVFMNSISSSIVGKRTSKPVEVLQYEEPKKRTRAQTKPKVAKGKQVIYDGIQTNSI